jgi:Ca-activated chloride channel family protein
MDIQIGSWSNLNLLSIVAAAVVVMVLAFFARRRAAARFATANLVGRMPAFGMSRRQVLKPLLLITALLALVLALLDVRWGKSWREVPQKGMEVMFVLDVSRSMLAEDVAPNRLERAKQQIDDMLEAMAGDRVGLIAFAGEARQLVPLTSHYQDFKQTLSDVGPENVDRGGSRLGDALRLAADGFLEQTGDHKAVVVFTDGEDQESDPVQVAGQLNRDQGIRIFTVGLGDMDRGSRIPERQTGRQRSYMQYHGQQVWSKMNGAVLKQVAMETGGAYIPAGTKQVDMAQVYHNFLASVGQQEFETARISSYVPRYQWFVGLALLVLVVDTLLPAARRRRASSSVVGWTFPSPDNRSDRTTTVETKSEKKVRPRSIGGAAACLALLLMLPQTLAAKEPANLVHRANEALHAGNLDQALADYQQAAQTEPNRPELLYNQAVAQYRKGDFGQARQLLAQAASTADDRLDSRVRYNLANCDYAEAVQVAGKDKSAAISKLQSAISHYRAALAENSADTDSRANIQTAQMLIDKLQHEDKQQKQDQQKQDQQKQDQHKQDQQKQDQQNQDQQKQDQQKQDQQKQDQQKQDQQKQDQQKQDQQKQDQQKQDQQNQDQQKRDQQKQTQNQQQRDQQQQTQNQQQRDQQQPEQLKEQQQQLGTGQPVGNPQFSHSESAAAADARPMTKEEAQKMLQAVRDRELLRRMEQRQQSRRHQVPVDRDW